MKSLGYANKLKSSLYCSIFPSSKTSNAGWPYIKSFIESATDIRHTLLLCGMVSTIPYELIHKDMLSKKNFQEVPIACEFNHHKHL